MVERDCPADVPLVVRSTGWSTSACSAHKGIGTIRHTLDRHTLDGWDYAQGLPTAVASAVHELLNVTTAWRLGTKYGRGVR